MIPSITVSELREMLDNGKDIQLIDVREPHEHAEFNIGGQLIPFGDIIDEMDSIETHKPVLFYCEKGIRSMIAIQRLQQKFPFTNLFNVSGGMSAWRKKFLP